MEGRGKGTPENTTHPALIPAGCTRSKSSNSGLFCSRQANKKTTAITETNWKEKILPGKEKSPKIKTVISTD